MKQFTIFSLLLYIFIMPLYGQSNDGNACSLRPSRLIELSDEDSIIIKKQISKINPEIKERFDSLHCRWYEAMGKGSIIVSSQMQTRILLPQYNELVTMGIEILPLVIEKMTDERYLFTQLIYEGLRPEDMKTMDNNKCLRGQRRAKEYIRLWFKENGRNQQ